MSTIIGGITGAIIGGLGAVLSYGILIVIALAALAYFGALSTLLVVLIVGIPFLIGALVGGVAGLVAGSEW